jgi:poly(hydroxyalkanoate) depolymerase family esterase
MSLPHINLSELSRMQRQWSSMMTHGEQGDGRLVEVEGFGSNPGALRMLAYVPPTLPAGAPLVVALHGCTQTAGGYDAGSGWSDLAERHGFAVLFPEQRRSNNANTCFNWFEPGDIARGEGEAASIRQMIAKCVADNGLNPQRVYVTGLSAGGAMTSVMLATYPDVFAGGAVIAGLPFGAAHGVQEALGAMHHPKNLPAQSWGDLVRVASPVRDATDRPPVAIWHGEADQTVKPGNALESAKQWANIHGLAETEGMEDAVDGVSHRVWRDGNGRAMVELYAIPGMGHGTPITPQAEGDRGVGHAMPFMLDGPISSTWHIAKSWGLLGPVSVEPAAKPAPALLTDPASVIKRALKAAGLFGAR